MLRSWIPYIIAFVLVLVTSFLHAQRLGKRYFAFRDSAEVRWEQGDFEGAARDYAKSKRRGSKLTAGSDLYLLAVARARAGKKRAATRSLRRAVRHDFADMQLISNHPDLNPIRNSKSWSRIQNRAQSKAGQLAAKRMVYRNPLLDEIIARNRAYLALRDSMGKALSAQEIDSLRQRADSAQALNGKLVTQFIDQYGWPGKRKLDEESRNALFYTLQSQSFEVRQKYFKVVRRAARNDVALRPYKAEYVDRLRLDQGKKQKFGTQYQHNAQQQTITLYPVLNPLSLDARRLRLGLEPVERWQKSIHMTIQF